VRFPVFVCLLVGCGVFSLSGSGCASGGSACDGVFLFCPLHRTPISAANVVCAGAFARYKHTTLWMGLSEKLPVVRGSLVPNCDT